MMKLTFWGTRGSIPSPGPDTVRYGGNTPCVEVQCDETILILDAGTGIRGLGNDLLSRANGAPLDLHLLISHFHWDHIQGFPFFVPAFISGNHLTLYGCDGIQEDLLASFQNLTRPDHFPVGLAEMPAGKDFRQLSGEPFSINDVRVQTRYVNHPGMSMGYRIEHRGKTVCYISDNEPQYYSSSSQENGANLGELMARAREGRILLSKTDEELVAFIRDADLLVHDSQYTLDEYQQKVTWGHSFFQFPVELALQANVGSLILFHHEPMHSDREIDQILGTCRVMIADRAADLPCEAAFEGLQIEI